MIPIRVCSENCPAVHVTPVRCASLSLKLTSSGLAQVAFSWVMVSGTEQYVQLPLCAALAAPRMLSFTCAVFEIVWRHTRNLSVSVCLCFYIASLLLIRLVLLATVFR